MVIAKAKYVDMRRANEISEIKVARIIAAHIAHMLLGLPQAISSSGRLDVQLAGLSTLCSSSQLDLLRFRRVLQ